MNSTHTSFLIRRARPIGWALTFLCFLLGSVWFYRPFGPAVENYTLMWSLVYGLVIITGAIMALSVKSRRHDLIIAGLLAFYSPVVIYYSAHLITRLFL